MNAKGEQHHVGGDFTAIGELDNAVLALNAQACGALGDELRAESRGLDVGAATEVGSGDAGGESEVVLAMRGAGASSAHLCDGAR